jgi:hypothetical protein
MHAWRLVALGLFSPDSSTGAGVLQLAAAAVEVMAAARTMQVLKIAPDRSHTILGGHMLAKEGGVGGGGGGE